MVIQHFERGLSEKEPYWDFILFLDYSSQKSMVGWTGGSSLLRMLSVRRMGNVVRKKSEKYSLSNGIFEYQHMIWKLSHGNLTQCPDNLTWMENLHRYQHMMYTLRGTAWLVPSNSLTWLTPDRTLKNSSNVHYVKQPTLAASRHLSKEVPNVLNLYHAVAHQRVEYCHDLGFFGIEGAQ